MPIRRCNRRSIWRNQSVQILLKRPQMLKRLEARRYKPGSIPTPSLKVAQRRRRVMKVNIISGSAKKSLPNIN